MGDERRRAGGRSMQRATLRRWLCRAVQAVAGVMPMTAAWACASGEDLGTAGVLHGKRCEPFAQAMWTHPGATGVTADGTRYTLGLVRLNRMGRRLTGHDPDRAAVVPVLSWHTAPGTRVALMPTLREGGVGASVIVSLRLGD